MNRNGCSGRCIAGVIIAIIFGGLFLWTLVDAIGLQWRAGSSYALAEYLLALVFIVVAKAAKMWAMNCGCRMGGMSGGAKCCSSDANCECPDETPKRAKKKR